MSGNADLEKRFVVARDTYDATKPDTVKAFDVVRNEAFDAGYAIKGGDVKDQSLSVTAKTKSLPLAPKEKRPTNPIKEALLRGDNA